MLKTLKTKAFPKIFMFVVALLLVSSFYLQPVFAACPENVVPNPLDPNCSLQQDITIGFLVNRAIVFLPFIIGVIVVAAFAYGSIRVALGGEEGREEGIKWMVNAGIGAVAISLLWIVLFFLSIFTGVDLLSAIGQ